MPKAQNRSSNVLERLWRALGLPGSEEIEKLLESEIASLQSQTKDLLKESAFHRLHTSPVQCWLGLGDLQGISFSISPRV
jgi:hypothetical protein